MQGYCTRGARGVDVVVDVSGKFLQTFKTIIWTAKFRGDYAAPPRRPISFNSFPLPSLSLSHTHSPVSHFLTLPSLSLSSLSLSLPSPRRLPPSPSSLSIAWACSDDAPAPLRLKGRVPRGGLPRRPPELRVRGRWARGPRTWEAQCGGECALVMRTGQAAHSFCYCEGEGEGGGRVTE